MTSIVATLIARRIEALAATSTLVRAGQLQDQASDADFVRCLNGLLVSRPSQHSKKTPASEADAVDKKGKLHPHAELVAFGDWLLVEGQPGHLRKGGRKPDGRVLLRTVAAALLDLSLRPLEEKHGLEPPRQSHRKLAINKADLARRWATLFGSDRKAELFDANLRTLRKIIPDYQAHLSRGKARFGGQVVRSSPQINAIRTGITPKPNSGKTAVASGAAASCPSAPATPTPFELDLVYSSDDERREHRQGVTGSVPLSRLTYTPTADTSHSSSKSPEMVFKPNLDRADYRFRAVIDKMVLLVETSHLTNGPSVWKRLEDDTGVTTYVQDLTETTSESWGAPLPKPGLTKKTGHHFAIQVQEPEPDLLTSLLHVLSKEFGLVGAVRLHLLEVAVDIYSKASSGPEALIQREQMVGLLQRHCWAPASAFTTEGVPSPRYKDARQYTGSKPKYLFNHSSRSSRAADDEIGEPEVRDRLLREVPGESLFLNATLYRGAEASDAMTRVQQKIADKRNPHKNTKTVLAPKDRRARVEVTLSGEATLASRGLETVDDLAKVSFRKLTQPYLSLWLPLVPEAGELQEDAKKQLQSRGVYGIELRNRARDEKDREERKRSGKPLPRKSGSQAMGLTRWTEMNESIGMALDELRKRWRACSSK